MPKGGFKSIVGLKSGELTVIEEFDDNDRGRCICKCSCGNIISVNRHSMKIGKAKSCGCKKYICKKTREKSIEKTLHKRFGRLVANEVDEAMTEEKGELCFKCTCDCGNVVSIEGRKLRKGINKSCGCLRSEKSSERLKEKWNDEEYRKMRSEQSRKTSEKYWGDENERAIRSEKVREATLKQWQNIEYRRKQVAAHGGDPDNMNINKSRAFKSPGYDKWKKDVFEREDYTCEKCGKRGCLLHAHHKNGYHWCEKGRVNLDNGACLCKECHDKFHAIYGKSYNTEEQYIAFLIEDFNNEENEN